MNQNHRSSGHGSRVNPSSEYASCTTSLMNSEARFVKKKSEVMIVPSLQAVRKTAPDACRFDDTLKTIFQWKSSVYKLVWKHMLVYYFVYIALTLLYEYCLDNTGKKYFEALVKYFSRNATSFNLMIMLGFFTSVTLQRLFTMQTGLPGTAKTISSFMMSLKLDLPEGEIIVHQYARWAVLSWILAIRRVSKPMYKKYADMKSLEDKGILMKKERAIIEQAEIEGDKTPRPLIVIGWMLLLLKECLTYNRYNNKSCHAKNVELLLTFKKNCGNMIKFATRNIPLALIQAVIIAVYYFGLVTIMARDLSYRDPNQQINKEIETQFPSKTIINNIESDDTAARNNTDQADKIIKMIISFVPIMPLMQFFIFFAWLTFGRMAVNPFGEDEIDIDLQELFDNHIENYRRLGKMYKEKLEDIFPDLPQKRFNEFALQSAAKEDPQPNNTSNNSMEKTVSSPDIKMLSASGPAFLNVTPQRQETQVTIHENNDTPSSIVMDKKYKKIPWWRKKKEDEESLPLKIVVKRD